MKNIKLILNVFILLMIVSFTGVNAKDVVINIDGDGNVTNTISGVNPSNPGDTAYMQSKYTYDVDEGLLTLTGNDNYYINFTSGGAVTQSSTASPVIKKLTSGSGCYFMMDTLDNANIDVPYATFNSTTVKNTTINGNSITFNNTSLLDNVNITAINQVMTNRPVKYNKATINSERLNSTYLDIVDSEMNVTYFNINSTISGTSTGSIINSKLTSTGTGSTNITTVNVINSTITGSGLRLAPNGSIDNSNIDIWYMYGPYENSTTGRTIKDSTVKTSTNMFGTYDMIENSTLDYNCDGLGSVKVRNIKNSEVKGAALTLIGGNITDSTVTMVTGRSFEPRVDVTGALTFNNSTFKPERVDSSYDMTFNDSLVDAERYSNSAKTTLNNTKMLIGGRTNNYYRPFYSSSVEFNDSYVLINNTNPTGDFTIQTGTNLTNIAAYDQNGNRLYPRDISSPYSTAYTYVDVDGTNQYSKYVLIGKPVKVTFKIKNGTWSDGTKDNKILNTYYLATIKDSDIPTGMIANTGYSNGSWNNNISLDILDDNYEYTYSFNNTPVDNNTDSNTTTETNPKTGESTLMYAIVLLGSTCGIIGVREYKKRLG